MTWIRMDDHFADHPKVMALGRDRLPGLGLWNIAASYCARHLTDGFVPAAYMASQAPRKLIEQMVAVGLFARCDGGYRLHDWLDYNPSRETVLTERRKKQAAGRAGGQASAQARAQAPATPSGSPVVQEVLNPRTRTPTPVTEVLQKVIGNGIPDVDDPVAVYLERTHRRNASQRERDWLEDLHSRFSRREVLVALRAAPDPRKPDYLRRVDSWLTGREAGAA